MSVCASNLSPSLDISNKPSPDEPTESDVSVDRRAARGHETPG